MSDGPEFDEIEIRCGRCDYQMPGPEDPLLATVTFGLVDGPSLRQPRVLIAKRLEGDEIEFWNQFKVGEGSDLPRGGALWEKPEEHGEDGIVLPCRRCHAEPRVARRTLVTEARLARRKGRTSLLISASGTIWSA
jgi:hypothetical protein